MGGIPLNPTKNALICLCIYCILCSKKWKNTNRSDLWTPKTHGKNPGVYALNIYGMYITPRWACPWFGRIFFPTLLPLRIRSGSWVWDPSGYHLQVLRSQWQGRTAKISIRLFFGGFFLGGVKSSWMFIYLFIYFVFFFGGGVMFSHMLHVLKGFSWNKHIWDTQGSTCRQACFVSVSRVLPSDPILVDRQVLGSYEVGWPNKASICWNLSWVTLWHLTVLPTGLKRQVESRLEIDILMICFVIHF